MENRIRASLPVLQALGASADLHISDGFGVPHRKHASVHDVAGRLPHAAGYMVTAKAAAPLAGCHRAAVRNPARRGEGRRQLDWFDPLPAPADEALIGGAMARPFLAAPGEADGADAGLADAADG